LCLLQPRNLWLQVINDYIYEFNQNLSLWILCVKNDNHILMGHHMIIRWWSGNKLEVSIFITFISSIWHSWLMTPHIWCNNHNPHFQPQILGIFHQPNPKYNLVMETWELKIGPTITWGEAQETWWLFWKYTKCSTVNLENLG
jgi:hypothetical protein